MSAISDIHTQTDLPDSRESKSINGRPYRTFCMAPDADAAKKHGGVPLCEEMAVSLFENFKPCKDDVEVAIYARLAQMSSPQLGLYTHVAFGQARGIMKIQAAEACGELGECSVFISCFAHNRTPDGKDYGDVDALCILPIVGVDDRVSRSSASALQPTWEITHGSTSTFAYVFAQPYTDIPEASSLLSIATGEDGAKSEPYIWCPVGVEGRWDPADSQRSALVQWNPHLLYTPQELRAHLAQLEFLDGALRKP